MYLVLLTLHSWGRWAVLLGLLLGIGRAYRGWWGSRPFTSLDNTVRHTVATLAHIQLTLGYALYFISPLIQSLRGSGADSSAPFFRWQHVAAMSVAVVALTIGSALAKRQSSSPAKFRTMALWFTAALLLIFLAIPWPFSPLASRPYFRF